MKEDLRPQVHRLSFSFDAMWRGTYYDSLWTIKSEGESVLLAENFINAVNPTVANSFYFLVEN
ncbi:hypothetical protein [Muriicola soli]|uniref:Uncharacterized protein n=1 Tax=Muriicola soli TaxID=2507538 RepID=A0A411EAP3_9FLAO|nr:hypothetical protein [Muriicola soli]QBA64795.1 hypothetical protein EQY75_09810 [Muriicola soli]